MSAAVRAVATAALVIAATACGDDQQTDRQAIVADRGGEVMPFDLDVTTHRFEPTSTGGIQTVIADDPTDAAQIRLVRDHLRRELARFRAGNFGDPETIHGEAMPGLDVLEARYDELDIAYRDVDAGGELRFRSNDADVVDALRDWFDAQLSDHGKHAEPG